MKYIRKKINLENFTVRSIPKSVLIKDSEGKTVINTDSPNYYYGTIPEYKIDEEGNFILTPFGQKIKNTIDVDIFMTQNIDDMGIFTDMPFVPSEETLAEKPIGFNSFTYGRLAGAPVSFYYTEPFSFTGNTDDSFLNQVASLILSNSGGNTFTPNLNTSYDPQNNYNGVLYDDSEKTVYKLGANPNDISNTGIKFTTLKNEYDKKVNELGKNESYNVTFFESDNGGWNQTNTSLSAISKKEEYLGVVFPPEVDSAVFINRGIADIFERHALLSEIKTTNDIDTNRGGFIRI